METTGLRIDEVVEHWFKTRGPWDEEKLLTRKEVTDEIVAQMVLCLRSRADGMPGLFEAIDFIQTLQPALKIGLASSSPMILIEAGITLYTHTTYNTKHLQ